MLSRLTGVERHSPLVRPRTLSSREPATLSPQRVRRRTARLKTCLVNHPGSTYRLSVIVMLLFERKARALLSERLHPASCPKRIARAVLSVWVEACALGRLRSRRAAVGRRPRTVRSTRRRAKPIGG